MDLHEAPQRDYEETIQKAMEAGGVDYETAKRWIKREYDEQDFELW